MMPAATASTRAGDSPIGGSTIELQNAAKEVVGSATHRRADG